MSLYLISYELRPQREYERLWNELRRYGAYRGLDCTWWLERDGVTSACLRDHFASFIEPEDRLVVARVEDWAGRWLKATPNDGKAAA